MRIGLDIDNVIADFDSGILKEYMLHDKTLRNTGIVNPDAEHIVKGMFDWSRDETTLFFSENMERIAALLEPCEGAKYYMEKLMEEGHELYLISHRVYPDYQYPEKTTLTWLEKWNIPYTKLIISKEKDKSPECLEHDISIMFDDSVRNIKALQKSGIHSFLVHTFYNKTNPGDLPIVNGFKGIYEQIQKELDSRFHVILDTDMENEADDPFALTYLLHAKEHMILDAVTIAPSSHRGDSDKEAAVQRSYDMTKELFALHHEDSTNMIYPGSIGFYQDGYEDITPAIQKMVEVIRRNKTTYILAIGAITNVAILLKKYPELQSRIRVVWLGGHSLMSKNNREYNFRQDIEAVRYVFQSGVHLTVIPCQNVASNLHTSIYELEHYLDINTGYGKFLYNRFYDDGKHGLQKRRVIWDISVIAYMINSAWFEQINVHAPDIDEELHYQFYNNAHMITFVTYLDADKIYEDLFQRIRTK